MKRFILSALTVLTVVTILTSVAHAVPREEITLTTIVPDQTVLIVKKGVVGYNYHRAAAANPDAIPNSDLYVEGNVGIGTTTPHIPAPNSLTGNLDVNDVWIRGAGDGAGAWASEATNSHNSDGAIITTLISTNSTTFVDMPDMSITLTTKGNNVFVSFSVQVNNHNNETLFQLLEDGVAVLQSGTGHTNQGKGSDNVSFQYLAKSLAAGSHTWRVQWRVDTGTSYTQDEVCKVVQTRSLIAIEV